MKKELAVFTLAIGLASTAPAFAGGEKVTAKKQPVKMTEQQLDRVTAAGHHSGLITIEVERNEIVKNVNVDVKAQTQVVALGAAGQGAIFR